MSEKIYTVYELICPNGWVYVGMTGQEPHRRWIPSHYKGCPFYNAILEFGWKNIQHVIVGQYPDRNEARLKERELTQMNINHCYNVLNTSIQHKAEYEFNTKHSVLKKYGGKI